MEALNAHFERPDGFDPLVHVMQAIVTLPRKYPFELLLKTDMATAQREVFDFLGILEAHQDGVLMRGSVEDLDWLARQVSIFSFDFVVIEPEELNKEIKKHAIKLGNVSNQK